MKRNSDASSTNSLDRRTVLKVAAAAATGAIAASASAQQRPPTTAPQTRPSTAPIPLGNSEPPAVHFQVYPGGTGAYLEKVWRQRGREAFDRKQITVEPWDGKVPGSEEEIAFLPVHRLSALISAKQLSAADLTEIYLGRLKRFDPVLLCAVTIMEEQARAAAKEADREIRAGTYRGPLHGIPWGVKDLFSTRGARTTWGAKEFEDRVIDEDAEVVRRLRDAGAILIAKLATGRFALGDQWYRGRTNNPWNVQQGSSGSSAGPASGTMAGCVAFAIGTETRGSIVSPAVRCGMSALRPTFGRVSRHGGMVLAWSMDKVGPMCRTIEDCALVFNVIHGADEKDPDTVTAPFEWQRRPDLSKLRIGFDEQAPAAFVEKLRELGANPKPIGARPSARGIDPLPVESAAAFEGLLSSGVVSEEADRNGRFTRGRTPTAMEFLQLQRRRQVVIGRMAELMKDFDLYVSGGGDVELTNQTGHPAVIVPFGMTQGEHPQPQCTTLIGDLFCDDKVLSVAHAYQNATQWHLKRPSIPVEG